MQEIIIGSATMKMSDSIVKSKLCYYFAFLGEPEHKLLLSHLKESSVAGRKGAKILAILTSRAVAGRWKSTTYGDLLPAIKHKQTKNMVATITQDMHYAKDLLLEFMADQVDEAARGCITLPRLHALVDRGAIRYFEVESESVRKQIRNPNNEHAFACKVEFAKLLYRKELLEKGRSKEVQAIGILDAINQQYLFLGLKYKCIALNQAKIFPSGGSPNLEKPLQTLLEEATGTPPPIILVYESVYMMLSSPDDSVHFERVKKFLGIDPTKVGFEGSTRNEIGIAPEELEVLHECYSNYCLRMINRGNRSYLKELCDFYLHQLEELFKDKKSEASQVDDAPKLPPAKYKNIVVALCWNGDIISAKDVAENYRFKLANAKDEGLFYRFARGVIDFYSGAYRSAKLEMEAVLQGFDDMFLGLDARCYLLKIYIASEDSDALAMAIASFRMYLNRAAEREKSMVERLKGYKVFMKYSSRYYSAVTSAEKERRTRFEKLLADLEKEEARTNISWLKERVLGLLKRSTV